MDCTHTFVASIGTRMVQPINSAVMAARMVHHAGGGDGGDPTTSTVWAMPSRGRASVRGGTEEEEEEGGDAIV